MTFSVEWLVAIFCLIFVALLYRLIQIVKHWWFAARYLSHLRKHIQINDYESEKKFKSYQWLIRKLNQIVEEMKFHDYKPAKSVRYFIKNLPDEFALINQPSPAVCLEEYIGILARRLRQLWNPVAIMMLPAHFILVDLLLGGLKAARIINTDTYHSFSHHKAMRILIWISASANVVLIPYNIIAGWANVKHFFSS